MFWGFSFSFETVASTGLKLTVVKARLNPNFVIQ